MPIEGQSQGRAVFPNELLDSNRAWAGKRPAKPLPPAEALPLAVVACFDPRLDGLLRPALGLGVGEGFLLRTAGAVVTPAALRSLSIAVYLFEVHQVLVVGHTSCRMADFPTSEFIAAFRGRGVAREAFGDGDLRTWAGAIPNPRDGVLASVAAIGGAPFLPSDLALAGAVLDDETGKLELVYRPGEPLPAAPPWPTERPGVAPPAPAAAEESTPAEPPREAAAAAQSGAAAAPPPPPLEALAPPLEAVRAAIGSLASKPGLRDELLRLRVALEREQSPVRQVILLQRFITGAAAESREIREAFEHLKREAASAGPKILNDLILPLLTGKPARGPRTSGPRTGRKRR